MNKEYAFLAKENERWQRRQLSRIIAVVIGLLALSVFAMDSFGQLPDKGTLADISGKTKTYLSTDAKHEKELSEAITKAKLTLADKSDEADFIIEYKVTEMRYVTDFNIPLETGQMDVYFYRDGRKVVVWSQSDSKSGRNGPAVNLLKKFVKERK